MSAYYNEFDKGAAAWLRELIKRGLIAPGDVDERSIVDVRPDDLAGYRQCHFFAGIGGWSYALRIAGWPDDRPVWTGSCPCQPFSAAGKREGFADDRHLWPVWFRLISECRPATVFGEQVASKDGLDWLDTVSADMEGAGYAIGAADLCAAGVGAPHIRQRLWFVADSVLSGRPEGRTVAGHGQATRCSAISMADAGSERHDRIDSLLWPGEGGRIEGELSETAGRREARGVAQGDTDDARLEGRRLSAERAGELTARAAGMGGLVNASSEQMGIPGRSRIAGSAGHWLADAESERWDGRESSPWAARRDCFEDSGDIGRPRPTNGFWRDADWLLCRDGKWRPVEPGTQQMVDGISRGMGLLRADHIAKEEMNHATEAVGLADQVLRALRSGHGAQAVWGSLGGCVGLPEATLLLASLCQQSRELGWFFDRATAGGAPGGEGIVRAVRQGAPEAACASPGRGCTEQLAWELGDALPELSQACPSARQHLDQLRQFTGSPLAHGIPARVGRLRGYGNAIVPQVAAEFIGAFLDVTETS